MLFYFKFVFWSGLGGLGFVALRYIRGRRLFLFCLSKLGFVAQRYIRGRRLSSSTQNSTIYSIVLLYFFV